MAFTPHWLDTAPPGSRPVRTEIGVSVDVAIFGAGPTGPSAALHLARKSAGVHVFVTETVGLRRLWAQRRHGHPGHVDRLPGGISRYGFDTAKACLRAHHDAVDAIQSLVKEENIDCGFARTGKLNLAPKTDRQ
ncbi:FAD-dependent oxidoreductase [Streptomyces sp. NPDC052236]|uniref:FAD-dependent oxidoreductase n=1 Tax=Streptomyces sp. NPDC052236 TaxID=3365686 RepID=UPI0037D0BD7A